MNRLNATLLICAALAAPSTVLAQAAQQDPRAQVSTGFGPQTTRPAARPTLLPPPVVDAPASTEPVQPAAEAGGVHPGGVAVVARRPEVERAVRPRPHHARAPPRQGQRELAMPRCTWRRRHRSHRTQP